MDDQELKDKMLREYLTPKYIADSATNTDPYPTGLDGQPHFDADAYGRNNAESYRATSDASNADPAMRKLYGDPTVSASLGGAKDDGPHAESTPGNDKAEAVKADGYANASDDSGVKEAQAGRNRADLISNVGRSLSHMFTARAQANGYKPDDGVFDSIAKQGQVGVDEAQAARQNSIKDYLAKRQMTREDKSDVMTGESHQLAQQVGHQSLDQGTERFAQEKRGYELTNEANDPTSEKSRMAQHLFTKAIGKEYAEDLAGMSANDINTYAAKPLELKAQIDAHKLQAQQNYDLKRGDKQREADTAFTGKFNTLAQAHTKAAAELDKQEDLIRQAGQSNGGIAGNLVKGGALHEALGRVSQGELSMAVDPSVVERAKRLWGSISEGKSLTDKDVGEFKAIMGGARQSLDNKYGQDADQMVSSYDRAQQRQSGYGAGLVGWKGLPAGGPAGGGTAPTATDVPKVRMFSPDGKAYDVPKDKVGDAKAKGWK